MTDIEKQIAQAAETRKSTAILSDPEHITEPLQILTFVNSFFHAYSSKTEQTYKEAYNNDMYNFGKMLINFVDPPSLATIINNGDYFIYWEQSKYKMDVWFEIFKNLNQKTNDANGVLTIASRLVPEKAYPITVVRNNQTLDVRVGSICIRLRYACIALMLVGPHHCRRKTGPSLAVSTFIIADGE